MTESGKSATLNLDNMLLLDALQLAPRASWSRIGEVLGITAVTAAKRWARLREGGIAWVTAAPAMAVRTAQCLAYVEITCHPEHRYTVANAIAQHRLAVSVELDDRRCRHPGQRGGGGLPDNVALPARAPRPGRARA